MNPNCEDSTATNLDISNFFQICNGLASCNISESYILEKKLFDPPTYTTKLNTDRYFTIPLKIVIEYDCPSK